MNVKSIMITTTIMAVLFFITLFLTYQKGDNSHIKGLKSTVKFIILILPLLFFGLGLANFIQTLLPAKKISIWIGTGSGIKGILIGMAVGALTPGGPYVVFPLLLALAKAGASISTLVSFITAWSILSVSRLPLEIAILGVRFTLLRIVCTFIFPPVAGLISHLLFKNITIF